MPSSKRQKVIASNILCSNKEAVEKMRRTPVLSFAMASLSEQRCCEANNIFCSNDEAVGKMMGAAKESSNTSED
jgi:hypothetical protein